MSPLPSALPAGLLGGRAADLMGGKDLGLCLPWLATPALWFGLLFLALGRPRRAAAAGPVALPLALAFLLADTGVLRAGYYAWAGSMALLLVAGLAGALREGDGPVRLPDAGPKFGEHRPAAGHEHGVRRPDDSLQPLP